MTSQKPLITILVVIIVLFTFAFTTQCISYMKDDVIITQNDKEIIVKEYKTHVSIDNSGTTFKTKIDSIYVKYKPNKILYDGILIKAENKKSNKVILKINKTISLKNNKTITYETTEDVSMYFSTKQIDEFKNKINKRIIITKTFYPRERIFYKFPKNETNI